MHRRPMTMTLLLSLGIVTSWTASAPAIDWLTPSYSNESSSHTDAAPASYLQYEPQNVPLPDETPLIPETLHDGLSGPVCEPEKELPWIAPYGTQFTVGWTSGSGDELGMTDIDFRQTLVFPHRQGFMITPGFSTHFLSGPETTDLPETLYDQWIEFRWLKKFNDRWAMDLAITPSLFTDYENTGSDAVRITGRAIAMWTIKPTFQLAMGVIYLDREDVKALPGVGAIWTPSDDYKVELLFPRPRVLRKLSSDGDTSRWIYLAGEFGGGSWGIDRADGSADVFTYSALRMLLGYEVKKPKGFAPRIEAGWIFSRKVEYKSGVGNYDPTDAAMIRFGGSF
ncbi:hypothetical protein GC163_20130 [bacterium]|nr:hypothetical protein [bacterium]